MWLDIIEYHENNLSWQTTCPMLFEDLIILADFRVTAVWGRSRGISWPQCYFQVLDIPKTYDLMVLGDASGENQQWQALLNRGRYQ
ncbi:Uncharacterized protein HZ326_21491 [Fusarium oxysporum f. sp. albedinis]|nr:Uncharacterized protein HZ326_21491 [Fusarium oxysporum f. sp. albedinis]